MFQNQRWANLRQHLVVALAFLAAGLAPETARAVVVMVPDGGEEKASLLAKAHQAGLAYPWVVGLWCSGEDEARLPATGSFIGFGPDGRTGYVLTAAHVLAIRDFHAREAKRPTGVQIVFGPTLKSYRASNGLTVQADRGFVHPEFQAFMTGSPAMPSGGPTMSIP